MKLKVKRKPAVTKQELTPEQQIGNFYRPERDGVTFSLLSNWTNCREKALQSLLGMTSKAEGMGRVYGTIVHAIDQQARDEHKAGKLKKPPSNEWISIQIKRLEALWKEENPLASKETLENLEMSLLLADNVMPYYFRYWQDDFKKMKHTRIESTFKLPAPGTFLRGKMDGNFVMVDAPKSGSWLLETKTKSRLGDAGETNLVDTLGYELQVNTYLVALNEIDGVTPAGVLYNIVRRPGLRPKVGESPVQFAERVTEDVKKRPDFYFIRFRMSVEKGEIREQGVKLHARIQEFMKWYRGESAHYNNSDHCENKYGTCEFIKICAHGDRSGHYKRPTVFRELEEL
jgi:hypothetical protein